MKKCLGILAVASLMLATGCGRNEVLDSQKSQRENVAPALSGTWQTACQNSRINTLKAEGDRLVFEQVSYFDPECQEKTRSVIHGGKYALANNFKTGVNNSIVWTADQNVTVVLYSDYDVEAQNDILTKLTNVKAGETAGVTVPTQKKAIIRENLRLKAVWALNQWRREEPQALNRLALEKLGGGIPAQPVTEQESRTGMRYELDNGFLQLNGLVYAH